MVVDQDLCIGCGKCVPYCPVRAISIVQKKAVIDQEICVECGTCGRKNNFVKCPGNALHEREDVTRHPRSIRKFFSDPMATHVETKVPGRGTEEVKTNDVTGRVDKKHYGIAIEMGRPSVAASYQDVEKMTMALSKFHIVHEPCNPIKYLFEDEKKGTLTREALEQRVISTIIEFNIEKDQLEEVLEAILETGKTLDTVFSLDLIARFDTPDAMPDIPVLARLGLEPRPNSKINLGLGKPLKEE
ncbi:MAG: 4Fe-4S binding protein [Lawsonibacter sp.]|nr:4Fe-4S binding protein [Lawsonibacter sp.]